jgi:hypothetical protein
MKQRLAIALVLILMLTLSADAATTMVVLAVDGMT